MHFPQHEGYMKKALEQAQKALECGEIPVGCVIVHDNKIITYSANNTERSGLAHSHAEILALETAAKILHAHSLEDCTLYSTLEPCGMCSGAIAHYRVGQVVFGAYDEEYGCMFSKINLPQIMGQTVKCIGGVLENECRLLLDACFAKIRKSL